ncbi:MAG: solute:sodium symporter family transporter [Cyclobacteriaceae bacterium]
MDHIVLASFIGLTGSVAIISYLNTKRNTTTTTEGHFFANRSNNFLIVGGALFLSNISANQFIGENESIFINNMSVIAWGVSSVFAILLVSEFMLPVYFKTGTMTIPDFLEKRYGPSTKRLVSVIFLASYLVNLLPSALYGGAIACIGILGIFDSTGISYWVQIWIVVWIIGSIGAAYTILGGLRAITVSDTVLSVGLLIIGLAIPYYGFEYLGDGDWYEGIQYMLANSGDKLNSIGGPNDEVPFMTIFTGMFIMNLYYWGMEQYIVQQALTAKNLAESQKGMALACVGKLLSPFLINVPGIIGVLIFSDLINTAEVFPRVVNATLPSLMTGLTGAVVFGAALTTFNAGLTSSSTLFTLNFYKPFKNSKGKEVSDKELIRSSKYFEIIVSLLVMFSAPFIFFSDTGFYTYLQKLAGMFSVPVFTIVLFGFFVKRSSPKAANSGVLFFLITYFILTYVLDLEIHFLHTLFFLFAITSLFLLISGRVSPALVLEKANHVESQVIPWKNRHWVAFALILMMIAVFALFSPIGIS